jgi:pimeloyl-ACP methyl ester carboxylesterase
MKRAENSFWNRIKGAKIVAEVFFYFKMKRQAEKTGVLALCPVVQFLRRENQDLRLHFMGHSFGGLLVTAAVAAEKGGFCTLILSQAAFSHNSFALHVFPRKMGSPKGRFRTVVDDKIPGPILVTHTRNDKSLRRWYSFASWMSQSEAAKIVPPAGGRYGAMGANGAQGLEDGKLMVGTLLAAGEHYHPAKFAPKVHNLNADRTVEGHHDVWGNQAIAELLAAAVVGTD